MSSEASSSSHAPEPTLRVLVYSDDRNTRQNVRFGIGKRPDRDLPAVEFIECATHHAVTDQMDAGTVDVAIFDGEAVPAGGLGLARQYKNEIFRCPPILVLTGRPEDGWLGNWSQADAILTQPIDPVSLSRTFVELARQRMAVAPVK